MLNKKTNGIKHSMTDMNRMSSERIINSTMNNNGNNQSSANIGALFHNVEDITRAINNLNNLVNSIGSAENN